MTSVAELLTLLELESPNLARKFPSLEEIYTGWWSGAIPKANTISRTCEFFPIRELRFLANAEGGAIASNGPYSFRIVAGEYVHGADGFVLLKRRSRWDTPFFAWYNSRWPQNEQMDLHPVRMYLAGDATSNEFIEQFEIAIQDLLTDNLWFSAKRRLSLGSYRDAAIIWTDFRSIEFVGRRFANMPLSEIEPPPFSLRYKNFGVTPHPRSGDSFGMLISQAVLSLVWSGEDSLQQKIEANEPLIEDMHILQAGLERITHA